MAPVTLRPMTTTDLPLLAGGESEFDDFGPHLARTDPTPPVLQEQGALVVVADGQVVGDVSWIWVRWGPNTASTSPMIGIWLRPEHRGHGYGTAAQAALVELFFAHTTTNRIQAHTDIDNLAEQRSLEKIGMRREGVTRGAQWRLGRFRDGYLYALLRSDPRPPVPG